MKTAYTVEQLGDAEKMSKLLTSIPPEKRTLTTMMANSFVAGMEAQRAVDNAAKASA